MSKGTLGSRFIAWAIENATVQVLVQIGSRTRTVGVAPADDYSDWDFQIVTSAPGILDSVAAIAQSGIGTPCVVTARRGRLGTSRKVTAIFEDGELDVVIISADQMLQVQQLIAGGASRIDSQVMRVLMDQALVLVGGYKMLKGDDSARRLFDFVAKSIPVPRIANAELHELANGFVCDYISAQRKVSRGELIAAQRWLHHYLAEVNFRLLHELRQRRSQTTFPDARRLETFVSASELETVSVEAALTSQSLAAAIEKSADSCRQLMTELVGNEWAWPNCLTPEH